MPWLAAAYKAQSQPVSSALRHGTGAGQGEGRKLVAEALDAEAGGLRRRANVHERTGDAA
ncbi:hypothetical protein ACP70R_022405 [Stipagrostis hirtigluma subsp. patula]